MFIAQCINQASFMLLLLQVLVMPKWEGVQVQARAAAGLHSEVPDEGADARPTLGLGGAVPIKCPDMVSTLQTGATRANSLGCGF